MGSGKTWTSDELTFLEENWGYKSVTEISKRLGRSLDAVIVMAKRRKLASAYTSGEYMSARMVSDLMRVDIHTVTDYWIAKCGLKSQHKAMNKCRKYYLIKLDDLKKWLFNNQEKWKSRNLELFALGEEPDWLKQKRKDDMNIPTRRFYKWTKYEDETASAMFRRGMSYKEIATQMNRSPCAVERRLSRIKIWK